METVKPVEGQAAQQEGATLLEEEKPIVASPTEDWKARHDVKEAQYKGLQREYGKLQQQLQAKELTASELGAIREEVAANRREMGIIAQYLAQSSENPDILEEKPKIAIKEMMEQSRLQGQQERLQSQSWDTYAKRIGADIESEAKEAELDIESEQFSEAKKLYEEGLQALRTGDYQGADKLTQARENARKVILKELKTQAGKKLQENTAEKQRKEELLKSETTSGQSASWDAVRQRFADGTASAKEQELYLKMRQERGL